MHMRSKQSWLDPVMKHAPHTDSLQDQLSLASSMSSNSAIGCLVQWYAHTSGHSRALIICTCFSACRRAKHQLSLQTLTGDVSSAAEVPQHEQGGHGCNSRGSDKGRHEHSVQASHAEGHCPAGSHHHQGQVCGQAGCPRCMAGGPQACVSSSVPTPQYNGACAECVCIHTTPCCLVIHCSFSSPFVTSYML